MADDIRRVLDGWPYEPDQIAVRKIVGDDGREKIQMRLDLGLLQMEVSGRPDGQRPHGFESLLHYHLDRLEKYRQRNGTDLGFELSPEQCQALRAEAVMYYHRYLSLFVLDEYEAVQRDTARNLQMLDFCRKYAADEADRFAFEQYRPYIIMMHTRAKAHQAMRVRAYRSARAHIDAGLRTIREFFQAYGQPEGFEQSSEVAILLALREQIGQEPPADRLSQLQEELAQAIREERYEDAARLRDQIARLRSHDREPS